MKLTLSKFLQRILEIRQIYGDVDIEIDGLWISHDTNTLELVDKVARRKDAVERVNQQTRIDTLKSMLRVHEQADGYGLGWGGFPSDNV